MERAKLLLKDRRKRADAAAALGYSLHRLGRHPQAIDELKESARITGNTETRMNLAIVYQTVGNHRRALYVFQSILRDFTKEHRARLRMFDSLLEIRQFEPAQRLLHQLKTAATADADLTKQVKLAEERLAGRRSAAP